MPERVKVGWPMPPAEQDIVLAVRLVGAARPKERARHGQGKTYSAEDTRAFESGVALQVRSAMRGRPPEEGHVGVRLHFVLSDRRSDVDNLVKSVLDGASLGKGTGRAIKNDQQVRTLVVTDEVDKANPHTVMVIYRLPGAST